VRSASARLLRRRAPLCASSLLFASLLLEPARSASAQSWAAVSARAGAPRRTADSVAVPVALLHLYPQLYQVSSNVQLITSFAEQALRAGAKIVVAPELATTGYSITPQQVRDSLGMRAPFPQLAPVRHLATIYGAYIALGIAEIGSDDSLYNSVILFAPDGSAVVQRKRGIAYWNARGDTPFTVVSTPYGKIGMVICSDTYLMDWTRILALEGADIILTPANWWGQAGQLPIWMTRAAENGVQLVVANRWGTERDPRFLTPADTPYVYNMNDAPSAVVAPGPSESIAPGRQLQLVFRANEDPQPRNRILFDTLRVLPGHSSRGGGPWSLISRETAAYQSLANGWYRPDSGNRPIPGLPAAGLTRVGVMSYVSSPDPIATFGRMDSLWRASGAPVDVLALPSYGLAIGPVPSDSNWAQAAPWPAVQSFVEAHGIQLLVTSAYASANGPNREAAIIVRPGVPMQLVPVTQGWPPATGYRRPPVLVDLGHARVGIVVDRDALLPEMSLSLAKSGADIVLSPFDFGTRAFAPDSGRGVPWPYNLWLTRANDGVSVVATNDFGFGMIVSNGGGYIDTLVTTRADQGRAFGMLALNSASTRTKYLNAYYSFDLQALLAGQRQVALRTRSAAARATAAGAVARTAPRARRVAALAAPALLVPLADSVQHQRAMPPGLRP
jgi:predicted amidohydrolase